MSRETSRHGDNVFQFEDHRRYTVQRTDSLISNESCRKPENSHFHAVLLCVIKWLTAVFLCTVVLCCIVASKIFLLVLGHHYRSIDQKGNSTTENTEIETNKQALFLMLLFALMIPQLVTFIYASWTSLRRKSRPWPTKRGFVLVMFGGLLETFSLCYITMVMLTVVPITPNAIILVMCSLPMMPATWKAIKSRSRWSTLAGKLDVIKFAISAAFAVIGIVLLLRKVPDASGQIGIPIALAFLSIAWSPKMRKLQIQSETDTYYRNRNGISTDVEQCTVQRPTTKRRAARCKAAIVCSLWNLILTPLVAILFADIFDIVKLDNIVSGFKAINATNPSFVFVMVHIVASFFGYHFGWLACSLCMQKIGYALPLTLATPIAVLMTHMWICDMYTIHLPCISEDPFNSLLAGAFLWLPQFYATTHYVWKSPGLVMAKAHDLFWIPGYNGVCLEQCLLLNKRNKVSDKEHNKEQKLRTNINIFICTTMYHEEDYEMEQLLRSIHDVDTHRKESGRHYESHIFFDGCVRAEKLDTFVLQLASLVEKTLMVHLRDCTKMKTPYGMQLIWELPGGMEFTVHLKDNVKVKNKKRWSQVMYMSYVLDYKQDLLNVKDDQAFILTTDADVKFTHDSVEALIDEIVEDPQIGAVCARTHPMGNGPVVWYQIFDYAIGHWFQKVANHMLGSVLCSPGCFSLYRCQAVRDVLPTYATGVDHAFDFLTKDMGEDRWMCTLMIQRGWRLSYCAAAVDSTYCPESFDEFYKQRRRWTPSTLANLVLLIKEWKLILKKNEHISFLFILYQTFLVCSNLIGPSTVVLVIVGGMVYSGINLSEVTTVVVVCLMVAAYTLVCLFTSQKLQLKVSKILTFVFAVIMCIVVIGVAVQISKELQERDAEPTALPTVRPNTTTTPATKPLEHHLPAGVSTLYLAGLSGIFIAAALLHPKEFNCLLHAVWYLMCLPSGYLLLTVYSICNITDRSWGTREGKSASEGEDWYKPLGNWIKEVCTSCHCCGTRTEIGQFEHASNQGAQRGNTVVKRISSIEEENLDSACENVGNPLDQTSNKEIEPLPSRGGQAEKMDDTDDTHSQTDGGLDENLKDNKPEFEQRKNCSVLAFESSTLLEVHVDVNHDYDKTPVTSYSKDEIQKVNEGKSGDKIISNEAAESAPSVEEVPWKDLISSALCDQVVPEQHLLTSDVNSEGHDDSCRRTLPSSQNSSSPSIIGETELNQLQGSETQTTVNSELSSRFGSISNLQALDENDRTLSLSQIEVSFLDINLPVEEWLPKEFKSYAPKFRAHGYDTMGFLFGMTDKDLERIGMERRGHRQRLLRYIKKIPRVDIEEGIPGNVEEWLKELSLGEYWPKFEASGYKEPSDLEDLKGMEKDSLKETFNIYHKPGHLNRLVSAIRKLQYPNQGQEKIRHTRRELDRLPLHYLDQDDRNEFEFWEGLRQIRLVPELSAFDQTSELKAKLVELRNTTLMIFVVTNALWMIIILTLMQHKDLKVLGVDIIGLGFLIIYGCIFVVQFMALLGHRFKTLVHVLARTPWKVSNTTVHPSKPTSSQQTAS